MFFGLSAAIGAKDPVAALKIIDRSVKEGKDVLQVVLGLIEHFRNIAMTKIDKDLEPLVDAGPESIKRYKEECGKFTVEDILRIIYSLSNAIDFIRKSGLVRIPLEAAMIKLTLSGSIAPLNDILKRLEDLQARGGPAAPARDAVPDPGTSMSDPRDEVSGGEKKNGDPPEQRAAGTGIEDVLAAWGSILNYIKGRKISIASYLYEAYPLSLISDTIKIGFPDEFRFHREAVDSPENRKLIEEALKEVVKLDLRVEISSMDRAVPPGGVTRNSCQESFSDGVATPESNGTKKIDPIIKSALDIFNGEIADKGL
jgi:hypothetical protein